MILISRSQSQDPEGWSDHDPESVSVDSINQLDTIGDMSIITITLFNNFQLCILVCTEICIRFFWAMDIRFSKKLKWFQQALLISLQSACNKLATSLQWYVEIKLSSFHFQFNYQGHVGSQWKFAKFRLWFGPMIIICCYSSFINGVDDVNCWQKCQFIICTYLNSENWT